MDNEKEFEISLKDLFRIFRQGLWIIVVTAVVFAIAAFGYSRFFVQKTYTSSVKFYVEATTSSDNAYNDLYSYNYATSLVNTYIEMLQTNSFYEKVADNLDNTYTASEIGSMVSFANDNETEVFSVSVVAKSPQAAKIVADSVASVAPGVISTLEDNAKLKIVDSAIVPTSPTSPNVSKNTIMAFLVGLVLAAIYVFVKDVTDTKIKYLPDTAEICDIPVIAAIPNFSGMTGQPTEYFIESDSASSDSNESEEK